MTRGEDATGSLEFEERRALNLSRGYDEARLRAMAQIEPHFLFNTLALKQRKEKLPVSESYAHLFRQM